REDASINVVVARAIQLQVSIRRRKQDRELSLKPGVHVSLAKPVSKTKLTGAGYDGPGHSAGRIVGDSLNPPGHLLGDRLDNGPLSFLDDLHHMRRQLFQLS